MGEISLLASSLINIADWTTNIVIMVSHYVSISYTVLVHHTASWITIMTITNRLSGDFTTWLHKTFVEGWLLPTFNGILLKLN